MLELEYLEAQASGPSWCLLKEFSSEAFCRWAALAPYFNSGWELHFSSAVEAVINGN